MGNLNCVGKRGLVVIVLMALFATAKSQVMWNLKGGWMQRNSIIGESSNGEWEKESRPEWMAGLELEIPLNEMLDLQTGLRWRNHKVFVEKDYNFLGIFNGDSYYNSYTTTRTFEAKHLAEIPLRLTYKQPLGNNFALHAGLGPYFSYVLDGAWDYYNQTNEKAGGSSQAVWEKAKFKDKIHVGLEASVAINWACLSLGATYNIPCFYKGYKDENKPAVMLTLGIRFKSHVWKYVGATLLAIASVGTAAAAVWPSNGGYSSYSSGSYSPSYNSSSSSYSGSSSSSVGKSCKFCAGSGRCSGTNRCRGDGQCKYCYGQGYKSTNGHYHECGVCKGTKKCTFCGGSGKCKHCGGTGKN